MFLDICRIVCELGASSSALDGAIVISVRNRFSDASNMHFSYVVSHTNCCSLFDVSIGGLSLVRF